MKKSLFLIGEQRIHPGMDDYTFISSAFNRLPKELAFPGDSARFIGYESCMKGKPHVRFFGIQAGDMESIPDGMVAWELNDKTWTVRQGKGEKRIVAWQEDIRWLWLEQTSVISGFTGNDSQSGNTLGEFTAKGSEAWHSGGHHVVREFLLFAGLYFDLRKSGFQDEVFLVDYDSSWPEQFHEMASRLRHRLGPDLILRIEHYGSTAVPGMPAKPIIDILVEVPSIMEAKIRALPRLIDTTWEYWWYDNHMVFFKRRAPMGERTHHIHMAPKGHQVWEGLAFRDYLRSHPEAAARYAALKQRLAGEYRHDRERYTDGKSAFIRELTAKAREAP